MKIYQAYINRFRSICGRYIGQPLTPNIVEEIKSKLEHQVETTSSIINEYMERCSEIVWLPDETSGELIPCLKPIEIIHQGNGNFTFSCKPVPDDQIIKYFSVEELLTSSSTFLRNIGKRLFSPQDCIKLDFVVSKDGVKFDEEDE